MRRSIKLPDNGLFVFGSNEGGIHGKGAALIAYRRFGAAWGQGFGISGRSFAIPTKDKHIRTLSLLKIQKYVDEFIAIASEQSDQLFYVTRVGCGLAGIDDRTMANMFDPHPKNCLFDFEWTKYINCKNFGPEYAVIE